MQDTPIFDRASLLKGGGTAALAALVAGALEGRADACCSPIDLMYTDDAMTAKARKPAAQAIKGIRIWSANPAHPPPGAPWQALFTIPNAHASGHDENNGNHGNPKKPKPLGYSITVYVSY